MITDLDPMLSEREERTLRSWLGDEPAVLPPHIWSAVMADVPATRQRRISPVTRLLPDRRWARMALAAALVTALVAGALAGAGATGFIRLPHPPYVFPTSEGPLDPGTYVVDAPFPAAASFDVPAGWASVEFGDSIVDLVRDAAIGPEVRMMAVDDVYIDACNPDRGLQRVGASGRDLAAAISHLARVDVTGPTDVVLGGRPASFLAIAAPSGPAQCTTHPDEPPYQMFALPLAYGLNPGDRFELWIVGDGDQRVAVIVAIQPGSTAADVAAARTIVESLRWGDEVPDARPAPEVTEEPVVEAGPPEPTFVPILPGVIYDTGGADLVIPLYAAGAPAGVEPVPGPYHFSLGPPAGWVGTTHGVVAADDSASIEAWSVATVHPDPCHWRSSRLDVLPRDLAGLTDALATAWSSLPGTAAPHAAPVADPPWMFRAARLVDLTVPTNIDPAACDGGTIHAWEDRDGTPRILRPGERIRLRIADFEPGLLVVAFASTPDASTATTEAADAAGFSLWIGIAPSRAGVPGARRAAWRPTRLTVLPRSGGPDGRRPRGAERAHSGVRELSTAVGQRSRCAAWRPTVILE